MQKLLQYLNSLRKLALEIGANLQKNFWRYLSLNNKTKKVAASVVLGTFVFGAATPAFAETKSTLESYSYIEQIEIS